jgi:hypothetical protein
MFTNIRILPTHGFRAATISWELPTSEAAGEVFVAFSISGTQGSWKVRNPDTPVAAATGFYVDHDLVMNSGSDIGYYRLLLTRDTVDTFSKPVGIFHDLERREYGYIHQAIRRNYLEMRAANGFPVYHCIPKDSGTPSDNTDPDTGQIQGMECPDVDPEDAAFGLKYKGGFFPPVLTWMRTISILKDTLDDRPDNLGSTETDITKVSLLPWPKPLRGHMFVDPVTDRRWIVGKDISSFLYRGIHPIGYEADLHFLQQSDPRYRFVVPEVDLRAYRKIKAWA